MGSFTVGEHTTPIMPPRIYEEARSGHVMLNLLGVGKYEQRGGINQDKWKIYLRAVFGNIGRGHVANSQSLDIHILSGLYSYR